MADDETIERSEQSVFSEDDSKRLGRFILNYNQTVHNLPFWGRVMRRMLIIYCDQLFSLKEFEYLAFSPLFRKVKDDERAPRYEIQSNEFDDIEAIELVTDWDARIKQIINEL